MILSGNNLIKKYNDKYIINDISIKINRGQIISLLGANGSGKTTIFYIIIGLTKPNQGKIFLNKEDITNYPMYKRAQKGISYLPQDSSIFRKLSVEDNIMGVLEMTKLSFNDRKKKLELLIKEFHLEYIRKNRGDLISGGERRRTEIARCLAVNPKFILLDEPFSGVDPISIENLKKIIMLLKKKHIGILITDHNIQEILSISDYNYLLYNGNIIKCGTTKELINDPILRKIYIGNRFIINNYIS